MKNITGILSAFLVIIGFLCCATQKGENQDNMKNYGSGDYEKVWKTIDSLENKGLPKSALEEVEKLYSQVKDKKEPATIWRCLIYKSKYISQLEEDGYYLALSNLEQELTTAAFPLSPLLETALAELYYRELENNFWKIRERTEVVNTDKEGEVQTWSAGQFLNRSKSLYLASLKHSESRNTNIKGFDEITTRPLNADVLRPSLYDFLAHRAIDYFNNSRSFLTEPVYKFNLNQEAAFWEVNRFVDVKFTTKDEDSGVYQALLLFQELLKKHQTDADKTALIDADLKRIEFVYQHSTLPEKDNRYLEALKSMSETYAASPGSAEIYAAIARQYVNKGSSYQPNHDNTGKENMANAVKYCDMGLRNHPTSYGADLCRAIRQQVFAKNMGLQTAEVQVTDQAFISHLTYKNIPKVWLRVIPLSPEEKTRLNEIDYKKKIPYLAKLDAAKNWNVILPEDNDYNSHSVDLKVDGLPIGNYALLVADNAGFDWEGGKATAFVYTQVSRLSYFQRLSAKSGYDFFVTDRVSGAPVDNATIEYYKQNRNNRNWSWQKAGELSTDEAGYAFFPGSDRNNYKIVIRKDADILDLDNSIRIYSRGKKNTRVHTHFFLDRKIYRPGQTVYFKGLVVEKDGKGMPQILANKEVTIDFLDANYQVVSSKVLRTNAYGTVNGSFTSPRIGLLGNMHLRSSAGGNVYFNVEEYKRPKFEVTFDPVKESYKLNDLVKVSGLAKAYAGSNVDGAQVQYRVVRNISYPYFPWWRRSYWRPYQAATEIVNGNTTTDANGKFEIEFTAKPDESSNSKYQPQFNFQVMVDITDITGETRSESFNVSVGYIALKVDIGVPEKLNRPQLDSFVISTQNLNYQFEAASGTIRISNLKAPLLPFRKRLWNEPDKFLYTKELFHEYFPKDAYQGEGDQENWPISKEVLNQKFNTAESKALKIDRSEMAVGHYVLVLNTKDKYGTPIELKKYFQVFDTENKRVAAANTAFVHQNKSTFSVGDQAQIFLASSYPGQQVLFELEHQDKIVKRKWLTIDQLVEERVAIEEVHRGNLHYAFTFVKDSRAFHQRGTLFVPWSNKDLQIEYATFRDKLLPGAKEKWQVKIMGNKKEQVAAEVLASMYDASLDAFAPNAWNLSLFPTFSSSLGLRDMSFGVANARLFGRNWNPTHNFRAQKNYRSLNWFNFYYIGNVRMLRNKMARSSRSDDVELMEMEAPMASEPAPAAAGQAMDSAEFSGAIDGDSIKEQGEGTPPESPTNAPDTDFGDVGVRTNLKETVFFLPELKTDADGNVIIEFTMNEALTRWKFMLLAHTQDLQSGLSQQEVVTQKDLMVMPNAPRFFREGDEIEFTAKVSNLSEGVLAGSARLELLNALTNEPINDLLGNVSPDLPFSAPAGQSAPLSWKLTIPAGEIYAITHRVVAKAGNFSDGEEAAVPVLTNRMLVTESMPLPVRGKQTKTFDFKRMEELSSSTTLQNHRLTLEYTSNPAWYAVQALPYLMEYPYDCTEQIFNRFYANSLATTVANAHPKIKSVFDAWKNTDALLSNLSKNQELKSALLEETPWVLQAQSEEQQKQNIGLLFDLTKMAEEQQIAAKKIVERQGSDGGFSWFPGGRSSHYITQYLVEGLGHLSALGVKVQDPNDGFATMLPNAVDYIDLKTVEHYKWLKKKGRLMDHDNLGALQVHYLYARSFFKSLPLSGDAEEAHAYFLAEAKEHWTDKNQYQQGMLALALHRMEEKTVPNDILKSLRETSLQSEELGMYWKTARGYYWYQHPIETQALMIEAFREVANDDKAVEEMRIWLLKNKQTSNWKTTKATAAAVYSLLIDDKNGSAGGWLLEDNPLQVSLGSVKVNPSKEELQAGTGYYKTSWQGNEIDPAMSKVTIENDNEVIAWGGLYWQYFEQLDKITSFEDTPLQMKKEVFKVTNSDRGPVLQALEDGAVLNPGDKVKVRIELRVDRDMEYVHMKDMRGSGFEPINVLSTYKYQDGLGYYESTKDVSTNFFMEYLPKGTYVFEYPMRTVYKGDFSNGITTIQCMYAPEFSSHSEGIRLKVE